MVISSAPRVMSAALLGIALVSGACDSSPSAFALESIPAPTVSPASSARLTSTHGRTLLSWMESAGGASSFRFAERTAEGWTEPRTITSGADLLVNSADVPSVLALADGSLAAHWMVERGTGPDSYDVRLAWSADDGSTWSASVSPHHDGTETQHGFVSLFERPGGGLGLVWLDGRGTSLDAPTMTAGGDMALRAAHYDTARHQEEEAVVDPRVCECCPTAATTTADGVLVAYRGRSAANVRDIQIARLQDAVWSAPATVHDDGWTLSACPVNGPAVDAIGTRVVIGWFTLQEAEGRAFVAFSSDSGRTFGAPIRVDDDSSRGRLQVAQLEDGSAAVAWIEYAERESHLRVRRIQPGGSRSEAVTVADGMGTQHPRMVRGEDELLLAWTENAVDGSVIRTARVTF